MVELSGLKGRFGREATKILLKSPLRKLQDF